MNYLDEFKVAFQEGQSVNTVGVATIKQAQESTEDGGINVLEITLTDGTKSRFNVRNGSKGSAGEGTDTGDVTYFGVPYESSVAEYYLNGGTDKMLLFATADGYDAVVTKVRENSDGTGDEDNSGESGGNSGGDTGSDGGEEGGNETGGENEGETGGGTGGEYVGGETIYYNCTKEGTYDSPVDNDAFKELTVKPFVAGEECYQYAYYLKDNKLYTCQTQGIYTEVAMPNFYVCGVKQFVSGEYCETGFYSYVVPSTYATRGYAVTRSVSDKGYDVEKICRLHIEAGVTSIPEEFMHKAYNLKHLSFADSKQITHLGEYAFAYTQISGKYDFSGLQDTTINNTFEACPKLEGLSLSGKVTTIAEKSFQFCLGLEYVTAENVTSIGAAAFQYCTSLKEIFADYSKITFGRFAFLLTPADASFVKTEMGQNGVVANSYLISDVLKDKNKFSCAQIHWSDAQLKAIRGVTAGSVSLPIPEMDNQHTDFYDNWKPIPTYFNGVYGRQRASGSCGMFCLLHVYNIMHPNAQYDTMYDFITREIAPKKIEFTQAMEEAFDCPSGQMIKQNNTAVSYEKGKYVSALDLPMALDDECTTWGEIGTVIWGICEVLGWKMTEVLFATGTDSGATVKQTVINELKAGKPVLMEIVGAADHPVTGVPGHNMHVVTAIGYNQETDKLKIVDSTFEYPADIVPMVYELPFEALITPHESSCIWTFNFGEVITMTDIDNKLGTLNTINEKLDKLLAGGSTGDSGGTGDANPYNFRIESGTLTVATDCLGAGDSKTYTLMTECTPGADFFIIQADDTEELYTVEVKSEDENGVEQTTTEKVSTYKYITQHTKTENPPTVIDGTNWFVGAFAQCGKKVGQRSSRATISFMCHVDTTYTWACGERQISCGNQNGFSIITHGVKAGKYNWTAYYWDE